MRKIELATPVALFHALIDFLLVFQIRSVGGTSRG